MGALGFRLRVLLIGLLLEILTGVESVPTNCSLDGTLCGTNSVCGASDGLCSCENSFFSIAGSNSDCKSLTEVEPRCTGFDSNCVFCGRNYEGPCRKCVAFMMANSSCVESCPNKFDVVIITEISSSSRICEETNTAVPLLPEWAIVVIIMGAIAILVVGAIFGIGVMVYILQRSTHGGFDVEAASHRETNIGESRSGTMRTTRSNSFSRFMGKLQSRDTEARDNSIVHANAIILSTSTDSDDSDEEIDGDEKTIFEYKMKKLRGESEVFLRMLNDMRNRFKELPPDSPVAEQYKKVMRDVTRLLYLLNKKPSRLEMPVDGIHLMKWAEKILKRYLASQEKTLKPSDYPNYVEDGRLAKDRVIFVKKLDKLRDHSEVFLRMLNEMRRRLKELRPESPKAQNYRAISKDVTRVLYLVNKRPSTAEMPVDGLELVTKTERLLDNYLSSQGEYMEYHLTTIDDSLQDAITEF